MPIEEQVYEIVRAIPKGKVMSYGKIGRMVGIGPRQVGRILHENPYPPKNLTLALSLVRRGKNEVPCHRVIRSDGTVATGYAFGGLGEQRKRLEKEGVKFRGDKIIKECFYD